MNENPETEFVRCPCCCTDYNKHDEPAEFERVSSWVFRQSMAALGKRNQGHKKSISPEESERRRQRIAFARQVKANKTITTNQ